MARMAEAGDSGAGHSEGGGRRAHAMRARAESARRRGRNTSRPPAPPEAQRRATNLERIHNLNRQNIIDDLALKARMHPEARMSAALLQEADGLMAGFGPIKNSINAELEKFRNGTYSTERPEEYAAAADRVRFAMYLTDKMGEMHGAVMEKDSESLLRVFVLAARGIQNMLSGNYFMKSGWQLMAPGEWGYLDLRVEPPFTACAQACGVKLLPIDNKIYLREFLERIGAR